jgi:hypothetical protein
LFFGVAEAGLKIDDCVVLLGKVPEANSHVIVDLWMFEPFLSEFLQILKELPLILPFDVGIGDSSDS